MCRVFHNTLGGWSQVADNKTLLLNHKTINCCEFASECNRIASNVKKEGHSVCVSVSVDIYS